MEAGEADPAPDSQRYLIARMPPACWPMSGTGRKILYHSHKHRPPKSMEESVCEWEDMAGEMLVTKETVAASDNHSLHCYLFCSLRVKSVPFVFRSDNFSYI